MWCDEASVKTKVREAVVESVQGAITGNQEGRGERISNNNKNGEEEVRSLKGLKKEKAKPDKGPVRGDERYIIFFPFSTKAEGWGG